MTFIVSTLSTQSWRSSDLRHIGYGKVATYLDRSYEVGDIILYIKLFHLETFYSIFTTHQCIKTYLFILFFLIYC